MDEGEMRSEQLFYVDGTWVAPLGTATIDVVDPATEEVIASIGDGGEEDIDRAVAAALRAGPAFAATAPAERIALLRAILAGFERRSEDLAQAMTREMGVPIQAARTVHLPSGPAHLNETIRVLESFAFARLRGSTMVQYEPIGVAGLITPWNFPINQVICKVAPALAAGCTMVLKPSEVSPLSAAILAEIIDEAGVPPGVFNLINGRGATAGQRLVVHPDVRMISFTGSTRAGVEIARLAADTVKRVTQELGGKSANIILDDADLDKAVMLGVARCFNNSGQSCVSPTRMLVPAHRHEAALDIARAAAQAARPGPTLDVATTLGPVANREQFERVQALIGQGIAEGARLVTGGTGRPDGIARGFYVKPTVFGAVTSGMAIAQQEIFGPVLSIMPYTDDDDAVRIANDTPYGLAAYVQSGDLDRARRIAGRLQAGMVHINYPPVDRGAPFGGVKQSGNGREWGEWGVHEYLELKAVIGHGA
jgi:aldehyde dehydrogenase (NAD+)